MKNLLKKSWQIVWHNNLLWLFGFFSAIFWTNEFNLLINNIKWFLNNLNLLLGAKIFNQTIFNLSVLNKLIKQLEFASLLRILLIFSPILIFFILAVIAQICLIKGVQEINQGKKINFKQSLKSAWPFFWPVFLLNLINLVSIYLLFTLLGLPFAHLFLKFGQNIWLIIYSILSLIILVPVSLIISFVIRFAIIDLVLKPKKLWISFKNAFYFFIRHWLKIIWLTIILAIFSLIFALILLILITAVFTPFLILSNFFYYLRILFGFWLMFFVSLILVVFLVCFLGGIFSAFQNTVWILFFQDFLKINPVDKK